MSGQNQPIYAAFIATLNTALLRCSVIRVRTPPARVYSCIHVHRCTCVLSSFRVHRGPSVQRCTRVHKCIRLHRRNCVLGWIFVRRDTLFHRGIRVHRCTRVHSCTCFIEAPVSIGAPVSSGALLSLEETKSITAPVSIGAKLEYILVYFGVKCEG